MLNQASKPINNKTRYCLVEVGSHGGNRIFDSSQDYQFFLSLFKYLLPRSKNIEQIGNEITNYGNSIYPLAYNLHPTGSEILINCLKVGDEECFVNDLMSLYAAYFLDKYKQKLTENYKVNDVAGVDLLKISRQIHTKPLNWRTYEYSSLRAYMYDDGYDWLATNFVKDLGYTSVEYLQYLVSKDNF